MLNFLGIGAQKAGTTWLYEQLRTHPQVRFPGGKELHFWNQPGERTLEWYRALFAAQDPAVREGEITPAYAFLPVETIRRVREHFPEVRLIYLLRNPIERAWSSALMALKRAELTIDETSDTWFVDHFRSRGSLQRGDYEQCIRNWLEVFPREQLLLRPFELIKTDPRALLTASARHIGVDPALWREEDLATLGRPVHRGSGEPIRPSLLPVLADIYDARIRRLQDFLGWDLSGWLAASATAGTAASPVLRDAVHDEATVAELQRELSEQERRLQRAKAEVAQCRGQIGSLGRAVTERDGQLRSLTDAVKELEWELASVVAAGRRRWTGGGLRGAVARALRAAYRRMPISWESRLALKGAVFRALAPLISSTAAYQAWQRHQQSPADLPPAGPAAARNGYVDIDDQADPGGARSTGWRAAVEAVLKQLFAQAHGTKAFTGSYVGLSPDHVDAGRLAVRAIAFYLPQFHPIRENDEWWGPGFTEWTNVSKAVPQFVGHYQPHLPGELGFYDLRLVDVQRRQVELARQYGIFGFCFHYYWFGGRRLLERPVNQYLATPDLDFPFCYCWANENWTRRWDGADHEVLIAQSHSPEDDLALIDDVIASFRDSRYIRVHGKPLFVVYRPALLPDARATTARWRARCKEVGVGDIFLVAAQTFDVVDPRDMGFDAAVEFPPHQAVAPEVSADLSFVNRQFAGRVYWYGDLVQHFCSKEPPDFPLFKTVAPNWDNEARKPGRGSIFTGSSPVEYARWLTCACEHAAGQPPDRGRLVFINAWNEWGEGAHLEPDRRFGYAYLQATAQVLRRYVAADDPVRQTVLALQRAFRRRADVAVIVHLGEERLVAEFCDAVAGMGLAADLLVSVRSDARPETVSEIARRLPGAYVETFDPRGRDVRPFLHMLDVLREHGYPIGCKLRLDALAEGAAPIRTPVAELIDALQRDPGVGLVTTAAGRAASALPASPDDQASPLVERLLLLVGAAELAGGGTGRAVPSGTFAFRVEALDRLLALRTLDAEFEVDLGQSDGTLADAVEQVVGNVVEGAGYRLGEPEPSPPDEESSRVAAVTGA